MRKNFSNSNFLGSQMDTDSDNDADPRVGLVNLADVMLVFACGLMLALTTYWNLDVSAMQEMSPGEKMTEVENVEQFKGNNNGSGGFVERGKVYQDPMTGKYYMLEEEAEKGKKANDEKATENNPTEKPTNRNTEEKKNE